MTLDVCGAAPRSWLMSSPKPSPPSLIGNCSTWSEGRACFQPAAMARAASAAVSVPLNLSGQTRTFIPSGQLITKIVRGLSWLDANAWLFAGPSGASDETHGRPASGVWRLVVVFSQQILAEIALKIAPDRMNVVGIVLRIVVLEQKCWTLDAIIMWLPFFRAARPAKVNLIETSFVDPGQILARQLRSQPLHVRLNQPHQARLPGFAQIRRRNSHLVQRLHFSLRLRDNLLRSSLGKDGLLALLRIQRINEIATKIFFVRQNSKAFAGTRPNFSRVGSHE